MEHTKPKATSTEPNKSPIEPKKPAEKEVVGVALEKENRVNDASSVKAAIDVTLSEKREEEKSSSVMEKTEKGFSEESSSGKMKPFLAVEHHECQGARNTMEDKCIIIKDFTTAKKNPSLDNVELVAAVCDGHGGHRAAKWTEERLPKCLKRSLDKEADVEIALKKAFEKVDKDWIESAAVDGSGTTCCLAMLEGGSACKKRKLWVANTGDSRCILSRKGEAVAMSVDHKPSRKDEKKRIRRNGGYVFKERVMGQLGVSRSIGDSHLKEIGKFLIPTPEVQSVEVEQDDEFGMIACDGLYDVMSNQEIVDLSRKMLLSGKSLKEVPAELIRVAIEEKGTLDNVSVIAFQLKKNIT